MDKRWVLSLIVPVSVCLVLLLAIGACGGNDEAPEPAATTAPAEAAATSVPAATATSVPEPVGAAKMGGELRIGMTAADIPFTDIAADQGGEGDRFVGFQLNQGLATWGWSGVAEPLPVPGLAESWKVDGKVWTFKLREGMTFHDGTPIDAEAVVASYDRFWNEDHPLYSSKVAGLTTWRWVGTCCEPDGSSYRAVDDMTVEISTFGTTGYTPWSVVYMGIGSPTEIEKWGEEFPEHHAGAGPFKMVEKTPRVALIMDRFEDYWGERPNIDRLIVRPLPEPTTRLAALRADEVDWIEVPPPDAIPALKEEGFQVFTKVYAHIWPYQINTRKPPFDNVLVRKAMNYAVDREGMCRDLLNGICVPALGFVYPGHDIFGTLKETYNYDPERAKELLKESGVELPIKFKLMISTAGSGQMLPIQMNEFLQRNLKEVGIDTEIVPVDWNSMLTRTIFRAPGYTFTDENEDFDATNISYAQQMPGMITTMLGTDAALNVGGYSNPEADRYFKAAEEALELAEMNRNLRKAHEIVVDDAPYLFIVHDLNPRVLNARVKGYVQDSSWYTNLWDLWIER